MLLVTLENDAAVKKNTFATQKIHILGLTFVHLLLPLGSHKIDLRLNLETQSDLFV